jgi:hypothetical protein
LLLNLGSSFPRSRQCQALLISFRRCHQHLLAFWRLGPASACGHCAATTRSNPFQVTGVTAGSGGAEIHCLYARRYGLGVWVRFGVSVTRLPCPETVPSYLWPRISARLV